MKTYSQAAIPSFSPIRPVELHLSFSRPLLFAIGALLFALLFLSTAGSIATMHSEVRHYLGMEDYVGVVPEHVEAAILDQTPLGTSYANVSRYLASRSIGADTTSTCQSSRDQRSLTCLLGIDHSAWTLVQASYTIGFEFDPAGKLRQVFACSADCVHART